MSIKDIMRYPVVSVSQNATIREAVALLSIHSISGMPVVDANGDLVGIVTEHDIIRHILPTYQDILSSDASILDKSILQDRVLQVQDDPVKNIMTKSVITLDEDTSILKAASTVMLKKIKRIPVVCGKKPIGIVGGIDILQAVMQGGI